MDKYLEPTRLCDSDSEEIRKKAREVIKDARTQKEAAVKIFYFVRDEIAYALDVYGVKASHTLRTGAGLCSQKPTLQIALLRAAGIPARYRHVSVRKELIKDILSGFAYNKLPEVVDTHPYCECCISGKWIACQALFDLKLFNAMKEKGFPMVRQIPTIDWDGENDLVVSTPWVVDDFGVFASLDDFLEKAAKQMGPRIIQRMAMYFSNLHTDNIRKG